MKNYSAIWFALILVSVNANAKIPESLAKAAAQNEIKDYRKKTDLARAERVLNLSSKELAGIEFEDLKRMNQEQLDQLYASISSGPIPSTIIDKPHIDFMGEVLSRKNSVQHIEASILGKLSEKGKSASLAVKLVKGIFCEKSDSLIDCMAEFIWSGKRFYKPTPQGDVQLRNGINPILKGIPAGDDKNLQALREKLSKIPTDSFYGTVEKGYNTHDSAFIN